MTSFRLATLLLPGLSAHLGPLQGWLNWGLLQSHGGAAPSMSFTQERNALLLAERPSMSHESSTGTADGAAFRSSLEQSRFRDAPPFARLSPR